MSVDASAVASVLGITTSYEDMRAGGVLFLPQRVMVVAQGKTGASYPLTKWQATSAGAAGVRYGFGSPIHLALRELLPANSDGVGTIPVTVYPLNDHASGVAASGTFTPSGTASKSSAYRFRIAGYLSDQFVIAKGAIALNDVLRAAGNAIAAVPYMPVTPTYTYGVVTASALSGTGNGTLTGLSVHSGSRPKPGAYSLECVTAVANGGVWKLTDPDGVVVESALTQTTGVGAATAFSDKGGLDFTITDGTTDFGVGAKFTITVPATNMLLPVNWKGSSGNDVFVEVLGESVGVTFTIVQPNGGLVNPDVTPAMNAVGNVWETMGLNCLNIEDATALDVIKNFGEGRWGELVHKPLVFFTGNTKAAVGDATAVSSQRRDDRVNAQLVAPGSVNLPFVVAARQLARIVKIANNNPPTGYQSQKATGIVPGDDGVQWDYLSRDIAVKAGSSTIEVVDSVVNIGDVVTFWRPTGEEPPAYRYVNDIVKLQNIIFNLSLIFAAPEWAAAPLVPDDQPVANGNARKPRSAKAAVNVLLGNLGLQAIISDPPTAKKATYAGIDSQNPKRLNVRVKVALSGNTNIKDVDLRFGFYFPALVAA